MQNFVLNLNLTLLRGLAFGLTLVILFMGCSRHTSPPQGSLRNLSAEQSHAQMAEMLKEIADRAAVDNIFVGDGIARQLRAELRTMNRATPRVERWLRTFQLAKAEMLLGNTAVSLQLFDEAFVMIQDDPDQVKPEILRQFYFDMAVANLRWGETENCCQRNVPESCIFPLSGAAIHTQTDGARAAIAWLDKVLQQTDPNEGLHLAAQWLTNVAYMTIGKYPKDVPAEYLIPGLEEKSNASLAWSPFHNVAQQAHVASFSLAGGAVAEDFDHDGQFDLAVSSFDPSEPIRIFWNQGDELFREEVDGSGLGEIVGGLNMVQADFDNDGWTDIVVARGGWLGASGNHPNSLLRNNGNRTFTDVTIAAGLAVQNYPTQTTAWSDFDLDGDLDLFVGNEHTRECAAPSQLFRNDGKGHFTDVARSAGVTNDRMAKGAAWGDFDNDRFPDLFVSNFRGANRLYHNQGNGIFVDRAVELGVEQPLASFTSWFCDVNQDGRLDLFVSAYTGGIAEIAAAMLQRPFDRQATIPRLYIQNEHGKFIESAKAWGLDKPVHPMGANFGDLDNNGTPDFYLGTGWPEFQELMPNVLYGNTGKRFEDVTSTARVGHLQKGHAVAMADFDLDGDLDIFEQMGGFARGDKYYDVLYENPGNQQRWVRVQCIGKQSNRSAIGARIAVHSLVGEVAETHFGWVGSGGSFGANPLTQHIGLGKATRIDRIEVYWPASNTTSVLSGPELDSLVVIHEGA